MVDMVARPLQGEAMAPLLDPVLQAFQSRFPDTGTTTIEAAGALAIRAQRGQVRRTGEPYVTVTAVAT